MLSNREISRRFGIYAELLLLHNGDERLSGLLSGASYRIRNMNEEILQLTGKDLSKLFRPEITRIINDLKDSGNIDALDELIELTPQGLFEMMRIRGLGGKKLSLLWHDAKIDSLDVLLEACKYNQVAKLAGFGAKTQENIIKAIEAYRSNENRVGSWVMEWQLLPIRQTGAKQAFV
jgi:DNA polymerase (family 10)